MPFERSDDFRHLGEIERPGQMENSGGIGDHRCRVKIIRLLIHAPHQQGPIGVAPQQQRGVDDIGPLDSRRMRRPRLAQCIDRAKRRAAR